MSLRYASQTFITIPNRYSLATVSAKAQAVYIWLCCMQNESGVCWPSIEQLVELTHTSRETVKRACKELEAAGLIARQFTEAHAMKTTNKYEVLIKDTEPLDGSNRAIGQLIMSHQDTQTAHNEPSEGPKTAKFTMAHNEPLTKTNIGIYINNSTNVELTNIRSSYGKPEINELLQYWNEVVGYPLNTKVKKNRAACQVLLNQHKSVESVKTLVRATAAAASSKYAPTISDYIDLQDKQKKLILWARKQASNEAPRF